MTVRMIIPGSHSLKDKRRALRGIKDRLRSRLNVSIAEVEHHDVWQTAVIGIACVGVEREPVEETLTAAAGIVRAARDVQVARCETEYL